MILGVGQFRSNMVFFQLILSHMQFIYIYIFYVHLAKYMYIYIWQFDYGIIVCTMVRIFHAGNFELFTLSSLLNLKHR